MSKKEYVGLDNLGYGAAEELFQDELTKIIKNINDPNTKAEAKRTIKLTLTLKPNENRSMCLSEISCTSTLATSRPFQSQIYVGVDGNGNALASEIEPPDQQSLFDATVTNDDGETIKVATGEVIQMAARG